MSLGRAFLAAFNHLPWPTGASAPVEEPEPPPLVAPVANDDSAGPFDEDTGDHDISVLANDIYSGTPTISIVGQTGPGTATIVGTGASSQIRIPTDAGFGAKTVTYSLSATNNDGSDEATLSVTIEEVVIDDPGVQQTMQTVLDTSPTVYLRLGDDSGDPQDQTANNIDGAISGTGPTYLRQTSRGAGIRTNGTCHIEIPHNTTHFQVARSDPRAVVDSEVVCGITAIVHVLNNDTAIFTKDTPGSDFRMGMGLFVHADGSVHFRAWSPWGSTAEIKTAAGVVTAGAEHDYQIGMGRAGCWLKVDGKTAHDAVRDLRHWFGWQFMLIGGAASHRPEGWNVRNTGPIQIGRHGTGTRTDATFTQFYAIVRFGRNNALTLGQAETIVGKSGTLAHPIYGRDSTTLGSGTTAAQLQSAIDSLSSGGGGRVILSAASYSFSTTVNLKAGVEIVAADGVGGRAEITFTGGARFETGQKTMTNLPTAQSGHTFSRTARTQSISGTSTDDDILIYCNSTGSYSAISNSSNTNFRTGEWLPLESRTSSTVTFARRPFTPSTPGNRSSGGFVCFFTPHRYISLRKLRIVTSSTIGDNFDYHTNGKPFLRLRGIRDLRVHDCEIRQLGTSSSHDSHIGIGTEALIDPQFSNSLLGTEAPDVNTTTGQHPYGVQHWGGSGQMHYLCEFRSGGWSTIDSVPGQAPQQWPGSVSATSNLTAVYDSRVDCVYQQNNAAATGSGGGDTNGGANAGGAHEIQFRIQHGITTHGGGATVGDAYSDHREITTNDKEYLGLAQGPEIGVVGVTVNSAPLYGYLRGSGTLTGGFLANISAPRNDNNNQSTASNSGIVIDGQPNSVHNVSFRNNNPTGGPIDIIL